MRLPFKRNYFAEYLKYGAYPFGINIQHNKFLSKLQHTIDRVLLEDLRYIRNYENQSLMKLSKHIYFIANTTPSELSINHLSQKIQLDKNVVDNTLFLLSKI
jgi:predicted AAA+ superfamily ATPase